MAIQCTIFVQISVGRMHHDEKLGRGRADRSFPLMKINFDREETYERMCEKSRKILWKHYGDGRDGSGSCIEKAQFEVTTTNGQKEVLPWTLENYLKASNVKYASRARVYCVLKRQDVEEGMLYSFNFSTVTLILMNRQ